jgi:lysozyme
MARHRTQDRLAFAGFALVIVAFAATQPLPPGAATPPVLGRHDRPGATSDAGGTTPHAASPATDGTAVGATSTAAGADGSPGGSRLHGIDVSHFQGDVDWSRAAGTGIAFAFVKATQGLHFVDPRFDANRSGAQAAEIPIGAYHFFSPADDPTAQAEHFLATVGTLAGGLPPVLDLEASAQGNGGGSISENALTWLSHVADKTGCTPIVYTNRAYWQAHLGAAFAAYPLWFAEYADRPRLPDGAPDWTFWQYSRHGDVDGIDIAVDLNRFAGSAADLTQLLCGGSQ